MSWKLTINGNQKVLTNVLLLHCNLLALRIYFCIRRVKHLTTQTIFDWHLLYIQKNKQIIANIQVITNAFLYYFDNCYTLSKVYVIHSMCGRNVLGHKRVLTPSLGWNSRRRLVVFYRGPTRSARCLRDVALVPPASGGGERSPCFDSYLRYFRSYR